MNRSTVTLPLIILPAANWSTLAVTEAFDLRVILSPVLSMLLFTPKDKVPVILRVSFKVEETLKPAGLEIFKSFNVLLLKILPAIFCAADPLKSIAPLDTSNVPEFVILPAIWMVPVTVRDALALIVRLLTASVLVSMG